MSYAITFKVSAEKAFLDLDKSLQRRIAKKLEALSVDPLSQGAEKLRGFEFYRVRVGDYRVIYEIHGEKLVVLILRIAHRREAYRDL